MPYSADQKKHLLQVARDSIQHGLDTKQPLTVSLTDFEPELQKNRACFVTLEINDQLRGCIGSLEARQPLIMDVCHNAFAAAFNDPRFAPLTQQELDTVSLHISVLTPPESMQFSSEDDLISQLRPGVDGLILSDQGRRGTFLPSVWEQLPEPEQFMKHLKNKAGLSLNHWSDTLTIQRYTTEMVE